MLANNTNTEKDSGPDITHLIPIKPPVSEIKSQLIPTSAIETLIPEELRNPS